MRFVVHGLAGAGCFDLPLYSEILKLEMPNDFCISATLDFRRNHALKKHIVELRMVIFEQVLPDETQLQPFAWLPG